MKPLTPLQEFYLIYIKAYLRHHGVAPMRKEIASILRVRPCTVTENLKLMERKGVISIEYRKPRGIRVN